MIDLSAPVIALAETGSTNDDARRLAVEGAVAGTTVWAGRQTAGRGRQGNSWMSTPGNLFMSMVLRPPVTAVKAGQLSFICAVALAETVEGMLAGQTATVNIKWPNDLMINDKKAAGILLESESSSPDNVGVVIAGIGLNIASAPEGATAIGTHLPEAPDPVQVLQGVRGNLITLYNQWAMANFDFASVRERWMHYSYKDGRHIRVRLPDEVFYGTFSGIDDTGALMVIEDNTGTLRHVASAEVFGL